MTNAFSKLKTFAWLLMIIVFPLRVMADHPSITEFNRWAGIDLPDGIEVTSARRGPDEWYLEGYALTQQIFDGFVDTVGGLGQARGVDVLRNEERQDHRRRFRMRIAVPRSVDTIIIDDGSSSKFPQMYPDSFR